MSQITRVSTEQVVTGTRTEPEKQLTDDQWGLISDLFSNPDVSPQGGRPRCDSRSCVESILWVLRTCARWRDLPTCFPSPATCWRRMKRWTDDGVWDRAWGRLLRKLDRQGKINHEESMADATFSSAKKGAHTLEKRSLEKEPKRWFSLTEMVFQPELFSRQQAETMSV